MHSLFFLLYVYDLAGKILKDHKYHHWVKKFQANLRFFPIVRANECYTVSLKSQIFPRQKVGTLSVLKE